MVQVASPTSYSRSLLMNTFTWRWIRLSNRIELVLIMMWFAIPQLFFTCVYLFIFYFQQRVGSINWYLSVIEERSFDWLSVAFSFLVFSILSCSRFARATCYCYLSRLTSRSIDERLLTIDSRLSMQHYNIPWSRWYYCQLPVASRNLCTKYQVPTSVGLYSYCHDHRWVLAHPQIFFLTRWLRSDSIKTFKMLKYIFMPRNHLF